MSHLMSFEGKGVYSPDGKVEMTPEQAEAHNREMDAQELAHWATKPDYFMPAYYHFPARMNSGPFRESFYPLMTGAYISTWRGSRLGTIISARVYRHNFGARMVSIQVQGSNGARYYGRASWDNGTVVRLRRMK